MKLLHRKSSRTAGCAWAVIALSILFLVFAGAEAQASRRLLDQVSDSVGSTPIGQLSVSGLWTSETTDGKVLPATGSMQLMQEGLNVSGHSKDNYGTCVIKGRLIPPNHFSFIKQYVGVRGEPINQPLSYDGYLSRDKDGGLTAKGQWVMTLPPSKSGRLPPVTKRGQWSARFVKPNVVRAPDPIRAPEPVATFQPQHFSAEHEVKADIQDKLVKFVIGIFVVAMFVLTLSVNYFRPSGVLDRATQRQYIPTQVQGQHQKLRAEWTRPLQPGGLPIGQRFEWRWWRPWGGKELNLPAAQRAKNPHMLVLGVGGKGKTRLIAKMIASDIESADRAVVVIDSNGELVELMARWISAHPDGKKLAKRTIIIDPTREESVSGFNPLAKPDNGDLQAAASAIVHGFKSIYQDAAPGAPGQWNAQTAGILRNAALLLIANGKTLVDLPTLLQDNDYRDLLLETVEKRKDERTEYGALLEAWTQYKKLARSEQWIDWVEPIMNRIGPVLSDPRIRALMTEPENEIRFADVIKERKILLVKLSQSDFGQNANLFGSLMVTGFQQAALMIFNPQRQRPTALYLDEFDRFIEKETLKAITTETQTLQIGLIGVGKTLQRIPEDFRSGIVITMGVINCFAISKKDADLLGPQMFRVDGRKERHQTIQDVVNRINESPQFLLITDEEKLNIDRLAGQEIRNFFCYRVGSVAGVFQMRSHDFPDIDDSRVELTLIEKMRNRKPPSIEPVQNKQEERIT